MSKNDETKPEMEISMQKPIVMRTEKARTRWLQWLLECCQCRRDIGVNGQLNTASEKVIVHASTCQTIMLANKHNKRPYAVHEIETGILR
jgi:hypothetical protein